MLLLFRQRLVARYALSSIDVTNSSLQLTRRSFLTTTSRDEPSAAATPKKKVATAKKPSIKAAEGETTTKKVAVKTPAAKKPVAEKAKAVKLKKPTRPKLTKEDKPPKPPGHAYVIFYTKYLKGLSDAHKPKSLADIAALSKDVGSMWRNLSEAEKQPFVDDFHRARAVYEIKRKAFFERLPTAKLDEMNRRRIARGSQKIRVPAGTVTDRIKRPVTSFFQFINAFRQSAEVEEIIRTSTDSPREIQQLIVKLAGEKWRAMDTDARAPYVEKYRKEYDAYHYQGISGS